MKSTMSHWYDMWIFVVDKAERRGFLWLLPESRFSFKFIKYSLIQSYMF